MALSTSPNEKSTSLKVRFVSCCRRIALFVVCCFGHFPWNRFVCFYCSVVVWSPAVVLSSVGLLAHDVFPRPLSSRRASGCEGKSRCGCCRRRCGCCCADFQHGT